MPKLQLATLLARKHPRHSGDATQYITHAIHVACSIDVHMGQLMVADCKRSALEKIRHFAEGPGPHDKKAGLPQRAIRKSSAPHVAMTVLANHPDSLARLPGRVKQGLACRIQL